MTHRLAKPSLEGTRHVAPKSCLGEGLRVSSGGSGEGRVEQNPGETGDSALGLQVDSLPRWELDFHKGHRLAELLGALC